jgi:uncharacterized protein (DUF58 family)
MLRWLDPLLNPMACLPSPPEVPKDSNAQTFLARLEALLQHWLKYALSGEKRSLLRGQGLDFADLREYTPGDDIRKIDWNVFARTLSPHVREYQEEKQLTLWLALDCTGSMHFGRTRTKLQQAIELAGLFSLMAARSSHRLGAVLIYPARSEIIPPKAGMAQVQVIADRLLSAALDQQHGKLSHDPLPKAFQQLAHVVQKHATVIVFSDFLSFSPMWAKPLGQLSRHSNLIHVVLEDTVEKALPAGLGLLPVLDPETGDVACLDTSDLQALAEYEALARVHRLQVRQQLEAMGTVIQVEAGEELSAVLLRVIRQQPRRRRAS